MGGEPGGPVSPEAMFVFWGAVAILALTPFIAIAALIVALAR